MRALITGSNRGLGLEFVRQLLARGDRVFATCRQPDEATELHNLREQYPDRLTIVALDVADAGTLDPAYEAVRAETDGLELLVNNAGLGGLSEDFGSFEQDAMLRRFAVNAVGPVLVLQRFIDLLRAGEGAKVVNLSSGVASLAQAEGRNHTYSASKTALNMYTRSLSFALKDEGIPMIAIDPGWVKTDMGGPDAWITPDESISGMLRVIDNLTRDQAGMYLHYTGSEIPW